MKKLILIFSSFICAVNAQNVPRETITFGVPVNSSSSSSGGTGQTNWDWRDITNLQSAQLPQSVITNQIPRTIVFGFDGGGTTIQSGIRGLTAIDFTGTITACKLLAYPSGSIEVRLYRTNSADASFPPTAAGSIGTNALTSDNYNIDATLTGWTTLLTSGDVFTVNIPTNALNITNLTMILKVQP